MKFRVRCNSLEEVCIPSSLFLSSANSASVHLFPSASFSFLTQIAPPPGSGLAGLLFPTDYLDGENAAFKQRVIQTVSFDPPTQNTHRHTQSRDSLCLGERNPPDNRRTRGGPAANLCRKLQKYHCEVAGGTEEVQRSRTHHVARAQEHTLQCAGYCTSVSSAIWDLIRPN